MNNILIQLVSNNTTLPKKVLASIWAFTLLPLFSFSQSLAYDAFKIGEANTNYYYEAPIFKHSDPDIEALINKTFKEEAFGNTVFIGDTEVNTTTWNTPKILKAIALGCGDESGTSDCSAISITYQILCNQNGFLSISVMTVSMGAHPFYDSKIININTRTGLKVDNSTLFKPNSDKILFSYIVAKFNKEKFEASERLQDIPEENIEFFSDDDFFKCALNMGEQFQNYIVTEKGISFIYICNPPARGGVELSYGIICSWDELIPYINPNGPLASFYSK